MITVDRIEGDRAVLEVAGELVEIAASALPEGAGEGAVLTLQVGDDDAVRAAAAARQERLAKKHDLPDTFEL